MADWEPIRPAGVYHGVSTKHLQAYVDEYVLRYNNRAITGRRGLSTLSFRGSRRFLPLRSGLFQEVKDVIALGDRDLVPGLRALRVALAVVLWHPISSLVMADLLSDYERKRSRATKHFDRLRESIQRFTDLEAERRVRGKFNANGSQYVFEVPLGKIDPDWTLMLGDFVYNTRAALDYLITALIRSAGNQEHEKSQFPIYGILPNVGWQNMDQWWDNDPSGAIARYLKDTPDGAKAALKPLQPFYGIPAVNPDQHPLAHLQLMSNRDKHRRLNLLVRNASLDFQGARGQPIFQVPPLDTRISQPDERDAYTVRLNTQDQSDMEMYLPCADRASARIVHECADIGRITQVVTDARCVNPAKRPMETTVPPSPIVAALCLS